MLKYKLTYFVLGFLFCFLHQYFVEYIALNWSSIPKSELFLVQNQLRKEEISFTISRYLYQFYGVNMSSKTSNWIEFKNENNLNSLLIYGNFTDKVSTIIYTGIFTENKRSYYSKELFVHQKKIFTKISVLVLVPFDQEKIKSYLNWLVKDEQNIEYIEKVVFLLSTFNREELELENLKNFVKNITANTFKKITWMEFKLPFSRGKFLDKAILHDSSHNHDTREFLERCLHLGSMVNSAYMPVLHSQYNPNFTGCDIRSISEMCGSWRWSGFGAVCTTKEMYIRAGRFNAKFTEWGKED
ncbi:hypothetical protein MXB_450, partial [Myxobolus squamalis]